MRILSVQYSSIVDEEIQEAKTEFRNAGHSIDKFILGFTGAVLSLTATTFTAADLIGNNALRIAAVWLIFLSLILSLTNLLLVALSFDLQRRILTIISNARTCVPHPNGSNKFSIKENYSSVISSLSNIKTLSKFSTTPKEILDKNVAVDTKLNCVERSGEELLDALAKVRSNPYGRAANFTLIASALLLVTGIGLMISFLASAKKSDEKARPHLIELAQGLQTPSNPNRVH